MAIKMFSKWQAYYVKLLSGLNFVISYISSRKNRKTDSFVCQQNDYLADDCNNQ